LAALSDLFTGFLPATLPVAPPRYLITILSLLLFAGIFSAMHWFLPDAEISWRDAIAGGVATAILVTGGKLLMELYLGNSDLTGLYGAAGSLVVILFWSYYSAMIVLFGAEFTKEWSHRHGRWAEPELGAMKVRMQEVQTD
jgi:membrane protein